MLNQFKASFQASQEAAGNFRKKVRVSSGQGGILRWSKSQKALGKLLADSVKRHVQFHVTQYGSGQSYIMARAWITWDGQEIANFSSVEWLMKSQQLARQIREANHVTDFNNLAQQEGYDWSYAQAAAIVHKQGIFSRDQFQDADDAD